MATPITPIRPLPLPLIRGVAPINPRLPIPAAPPSGIAGLLARPGAAQALLAFGTQLLAESDRPGTSLGGAIGRSLPAGIGAFQQGAQEARTNELIANAPPEMQRLLRALPPAERVPALLNLMRRPDPVVVGDSLVRPDTGDVVFSETPEAPAEIQTFREYMDMTPEQQAQYREFLAAKRPPGTTVNVNAGAEGGIQKAIGEAAFKTIEGAEGARGNIQKVETIDRVIEIVSNPKFRDVSGPLFGNKWGELRARFADDPEARALLAEFNALGGQMTMAQLEAFTGPKTDFEFQQARRLAFNDPSMTPEEIAAGLRVYRRAAIEDSQRWADKMLGLDPERLNFDPEDVRPQLNLAQQIRGMFGGAAVQGTGADPLGIRQ